MRICCHSQDPHFRVGDAESRGVPCRVVVDLGLNRSSDHHPCLLAPSSAPSTPPQSTCLLPSPCAASPGPPTALHPASRGPGLAPASSCFSASFLHNPYIISHPYMYIHTCTSIYVHPYMTTGKTICYYFLIIRLYSNLASCTKRKIFYIKNIPFRITRYVTFSCNVLCCLFI